LGEEYNVISEELNRKNREIEREYETTKIQMQEVCPVKLGQPMESRIWAWTAG
jgi:hypothetical protein